MKVSELIMETPKKGTYAAVNFSDKTKKAVQNYIDKNDIPNPLNSDKFHTTLLYSRKHLPDYEPKGEYEESLVGTPTGFEKWPSQPDEDGNVSMCLVLKFDCPELTQRHHDLMDEHQATFDYPEYKTHITLSYNVGDLQCADLPDFPENLEIVGEYGDDLNLNWAKENTKKDK